MNVGDEFGPSDWLEITQERIDRFAEATDDHQWIHVDPEQAGQGPFGTTIAHGFLTLSLIPMFNGQCIRMPSVTMSVNYGTNKVRFTNPVSAGSRLRGRFTVKGIEDIKGGAQVTMGVIVEIEGMDKPACVAEAVSLRYE